jgi:hypothetical protein
MALFLRELAASQSVSQAAKAVGMSRQSAYKLRARLVGTPFAFGWEVALEAGLAQLAHAMLDRAVNGVEVPHYYKGEVVGTTRHYDERLSIWLMGNPWKVGRQQLAREYSAEGFDRLIERIEDGPLDWGGDYAGAADQLPGLSPPAETAEEAGERQGEFLNTRSWYSAAAAEGAARSGRGRGR